MIKDLKAFHLKGVVKRVVFGTMVQETPHFYAIKKVLKVHGEPRAVYTETVSKFDIDFIEEEKNANKRLLEV